MNKDQQDTQDSVIFDNTLEKNIHVTQSLLVDLIEADAVQGSSIFDSKQIPPISIEAYLRRIHKYTHYSPQCLILAVIYLDRYNLAVREFSLNWYNVHRVILGCLIMAVKFHDDIYFDNYAFEMSGGIRAYKLFQFQLQLLQKLQYTAYVEDTEYEDLKEKLYSVYAE